MFWGPHRFIMMPNHSLQLKARGRTRLLECWLDTASCLILHLAVSIWHLMKWQIWPKVGLAGLKALNITNSGCFPDLLLDPCPGRYLACETKTAFQSTGELIFRSSLCDLACPPPLNPFSSLQMASSIFPILWIIQLCFILSVCSTGLGRSTYN